MAMDQEPTIWARIWDYAWALLPYWWLIVAGGVLAVEPMIEAFVPRNWQEPINNYWPKERRHQHFRVASVIALFVASFLAFDDVSTRNRSLTADLAKTNGELQEMTQERDKALAEKNTTAQQELPAQQTKYVCTTSVAAKSSGHYAMLVEFGVKGFMSNGFAAVIAIDQPITKAFSWEGEPLRTDVPSEMAGMYIMSLSKIEGNVYRRSFESPDITPQKSEYIYVEAEKPFNVQGVRFLEDFDALSDQIKANTLGATYQTCPR